MVYEEFTKDGGLFLKKSTSHDDLWKPLNQKEAQEKIGQNLRDKKKRKFQSVAASQSNSVETETKKAANDDDPGTKSTEGKMKQPPNTTEAAPSDTSDTLLAVMPDASDCPNAFKPAPVQNGIDRTLLS